MAKELPYSDIYNSDFKALRFYAQAFIDRKSFAELSNDELDDLRAIGLVVADTARTELTKRAKIETLEVRLAKLRGKE